MNYKNSAAQIMTNFASRCGKFKFNTLNYRAIQTIRIPTYREGTITEIFFFVQNQLNLTESFFKENIFNSDKMENFS